MTNRPLAIIGFMGCGKSTVGRMVAAELLFPFSDLDRETEDLSGERIPFLVDRYGELAYRDYESMALYRVAPGGGVLATSGGCVMLRRNRRLLEEAYYTIFLDVPFNVLMSRISGTPRPLLRSMSPEELQRLWELRRPLYQSLADVTLDGTRPVQDLVNEIVDMYYR